VWFAGGGFRIPRKVRANETQIPTKGAYKYSSGQKNNWEREEVLFETRKKLQTAHIGEGKPLRGTEAPEKQHLTRFRVLGKPRERGGGGKPYGSDM